MQLKDIFVVESYAFHNNIYQININYTKGKYKNKSHHTIFFSNIYINAINAFLLLCQQ